MKDSHKRAIADMINEDNFSSRLIGLRGRWQDEKEYGDFADYEDVMKGMLPDSRMIFLKGTKRPFGFHMSMEGVTYKIFLKSKGNYITICAQEAQ